MGLIRLKTDRYSGWTMRTQNGLLHDFSRKDLEAAAGRMEKDEDEFAVVEYVAEVDGSAFMQVCSDGNGLFHLEVQKQKEDGFIIYGKNGFAKQEMMDLLTRYIMAGKAPDTDGWTVIMEA